MRNAWNWLERKFWPIVGLLVISGALLALGPCIAMIPAKGHSQHVLGGVAVALVIGPAFVWATLVGVTIALCVGYSVWMESLKAVRAPKPEPKTRGRDYY